MAGQFGVGRPPATQGGLGRMWRGVVTRIGPDGIPRVEIKKLAPKFEFKCEDYSRLTFTTSSTDDDGGGSDAPHTHTVTTAALTAGTEVIVGFLGPDEAVILGRKV